MQESGFRLTLHCFTGSDSVSALAATGKAKLLKHIQNNESKERCMENIQGQRSELYSQQLLVSDLMAVQPWWDCTALQIMLHVRPVDGRGTLYTVRSQNIED
jgi:hypothetical protein